MVIVPDEVKMNIGEIADLFGIYYRTAKQHIRSIEKSGISDGNHSGSYICESSKIYPDYYELEMIIALAFRVQSYHAAILRKWFMEKIIAGLNRNPKFPVTALDWNFSLN